MATAVQDFGCDYASPSNSGYLVCVRAEHQSGSGASQWADLADYSSADDFTTLANEWAGSLGAEGWQVVDVEGFPDGTEWAKFWEYQKDSETEWSDNRFDAVLQFVAYGYNAEDIFAYQGKYSDELAFTQDLVEELGVLPPSGIARDYFDYESYSRDLFINDYFSVDVDGGVYVYQRI